MSEFDPAEGSTKKISISFGALSPRLSEQLDDQGVRFATTAGALHLQKDADALTRLAVRGVLTEAQVAVARKRLVGLIMREAKEAGDE